MTVPSRWSAWHLDYDDPSSVLSRRLFLVQREIAAWLDDRPNAELTVVSICAGQGRDLLGVLAGRCDAHRIHATLLESDESNVHAARDAIAAAGLSAVRVRQADAGHLGAYQEAVPADLVLMAGVIGNLSDGDVRRTIAGLPQLCSAAATVIWTRTRRAPDLTPQIRHWLEAADFVEQAFHAPVGVLFSVGVHRFAGVPEPLDPPARLFTFR